MENSTDVYSEHLEKSLYDILKVSNTASKDEIRKVFLHLSRQYHPDKAFSNYQAENIENELRRDESEEAVKKRITEKYVDILDAYTILSNDKLRMKYDETWTKNFYFDKDEYEDEDETNEEYLTKEIHSFLRWYRQKDVYTLENLEDEILITITLKELNVPSKGQRESGLKIPPRYFVNKKLAIIKKEFVDRMVKTLL